MCLADGYGVAVGGARHCEIKLRETRGGLNHVRVSRDFNLIGRIGSRNADMQK